MKIVKRSEWHARPADPYHTRPLDQVIGVCFHHTDSPKPNLFLTGARAARNVQAFHMDVRGYPDIAYNALIGPGGRIYEGHSIHQMGLHSNGTWKGMSANRHLLAISFIGRYSNGDVLTDKAKQAARGLLWLWGMQLNKPLDLCGHGETKPTGCPGTVMSFVEELRRDR